MSANMEISTVVGCKMGCTYCPQKTHIKNYFGNEKRMSFDTFMICLKKIPKEVDIVFAGMSEPFLNDDCLLMMALAFERGHKVSLFTTCYGMKLSDVEVMKHWQFNHFCIHLPDADGLMTLKVTPEYLEVLKSCLPLATNKMCAGTLHKEVEKITGKIDSGNDGLYSRAGNIEALAIEPKKGKLYCSATGKERIDHNVLLPNGDTVLCCMDYSQDHIIGNLLKDSYENLFNSKEYLKVIEGLEDGNSNILCRTCEVAANA